MNVDKFGHHVHKRLRKSITSDSEKILKTENGEFDLHSTRLKGVKLPLASDDVVNKEYVDSLTKQFCTSDDLGVGLQKIKTDILILVKKYVEVKIKEAK